MSAARLAIVGTRVLRCPNDFVRAGVHAQAMIERLRPEVVITGGGRGSNAVAMIVAHALGFTRDNGTLIVYEPSASGYNVPGGYRDRDTLIVADCTHLLRLWCHQATTRGSQWTADAAVAAGRTVIHREVCDPVAVAGPQTLRPTRRQRADDS